MLPKGQIRSQCSHLKKSQWCLQTLSCSLWCRGRTKGRNRDLNLFPSQCLRKSCWRWERRPLISLPRRTELKRQKLQSGLLVSGAPGPDHGQSTGQSRPLPMYQERGLSCLPNVSPGWKNSLQKNKAEDRFGLLLPQCLCLHLGCTRQTCQAESKQLLKILT